MEPAIYIDEPADDWFQALPDELFCSIFSYFPIVHIYPTLSLVSSIFRRRMQSVCLWWSVEGLAHSGPRVFSARQVQALLDFLQSTGLSSHIRQLDIPRSKSALPCPTTEPWAQFLSRLHHLSVRNSTLGSASNTMGEDCLVAVSQPMVWPKLKFLNFTNVNLTHSAFFRYVTVPNVETMVLSGVVANSMEDLKNFITRSGNMLSKLDISRTRLDECAVASIIRSCPQLVTLIATELKWRPLEESIQYTYQHLKIRTQLLPHRRDNLCQRLLDVECLYDVDGKGCSLLADAIYVGIKCEVIQFLIQALDIDVNRCDSPPSPWCLPYPTKFIESFELLRAPLAFHQAVMLNKFDIADMLLECGANRFQETPVGLNPLMTVLSSTIIDVKSCERAVTYLISLGMKFPPVTLPLAMDRGLCDEVISEMIDLREGEWNLDSMISEATDKNRPQVVIQLLRELCRPSSWMMEMNCSVQALQPTVDLAETPADSA